MKKPYTKDRFIEAHPAGFFIITPQDYEDPVPLSCPVCSNLLRPRDDAEAYVEVSCCNHCALKWAHPRREAWADGWRPSPSDVTADNSERLPIVVELKLQ